MPKGFSRAPRALKKAPRPFPVRGRRNRRDDRRGTPERGERRPPPAIRRRRGSRNAPALFTPARSRVSRANVASRHLAASARPGRKAAGVARLPRREWTRPAFRRARRRPANPLSRRALGRAGAFPSARPRPVRRPAAPLKGRLRPRFPRRGAFFSPFAAREKPARTPKTVPPPPPAERGKERPARPANSRVPAGAGSPRVFPSPPVSSVTCARKQTPWSRIWRRRRRERRSPTPLSPPCSPPRRSSKKAACAPVSRVGARFFRLSPRAKSPPEPQKQFRRLPLPSAARSAQRGPRTLAFRPRAGLRSLFPPRAAVFFETPPRAARASRRGRFQ